MTAHHHEQWQLQDHPDGGKVCAVCGDRTTTDGRTSVPEPKPEPDYLQVFMPHEDVIDAFKRWVLSQGWELRPIPRFDEDDDTYVKTHMIVPANLGELMRQRAAEIREKRTTRNDI